MKSAFWCLWEIKSLMLLEAKQASVQEQLILAKTKETAKSKQVLCTFFFFFPWVKNSRLCERKVCLAFLSVLAQDLSCELCNTYSSLTLLFFAVQRTVKILTCVRERETEREKKGHLKSEQTFYLGVWCFLLLGQHVLILNVSEIEVQVE